MCPSPRARSGTAPVRIVRPRGKVLRRTPQPRTAECNAPPRRRLPTRGRNRSADNDRGADALVETFGDPLDALGGGVEGRRHGGLGRLAAIGRRHPGLLQAGQLGLEPAHALAGLVELVADRQRRHDQEAIVADLAKAAAQLLDMAVELVGQALEMALLSILAGHTILAAIDGD